jgi:redox-sensing transcriptional repressor
MAAGSLFDNKVSLATMERLPRYLMELYRLRAQGEKNVSSQILGEPLGIKDTQIRKDLSYFGVFGKARYGYHLDFLIESIENILGLAQNYTMAIIGLGNIGRGLTYYKSSELEKFEVKLLFDKNPELINTEIMGLVIHDVKELKKLVKKEKIDIGIIATPDEATIEIAESLVEAGVKAIYNFSHAEIGEFEEEVYIENANISHGLFKLTHYLNGNWPRKY